MKGKVKKNNSFRFLLIVFAGLLAIFLIAVYFNKISNNSYNQSLINNSSSETKIYKSKDLGFSIEVPFNSEIVENLGSLIIKLEDGNILIGQNATNFNNLTDYILNSRNNLQSRMLDRRDLTINGLEAVLGSVDNEKLYLIYTDYNVYHIYTTSQTLFDDLDKIAQSFKYTP